MRVLTEVRMGVIGAGAMGRAHARSIAEGKVPRMRLTAISDTGKAETWEGARGFAESGEMIRSGEVDAVLIATPHYSHTTIGIDALEQGLHVLVEKPISVQKRDCERLLAAHEGREEQVFAAMFNQRTDPFYQKIRALVRGGDLGEIQRMNWIVTNWFRTEAYYAGNAWRGTWAGEGGGVLMNQCPHNLDLLQWIFGMPVRVRAFCGFGRYHEIEVEDEVTAYMEFENGAAGVFVASTGEAPGTNRLEIAGELGRLVYEHDRITFTRLERSAREFSRDSKEGFAMPPGSEVSVPVPGHGEQHTGILRNFAEAILDGAALIAPAEEGIRSVELANAMLYSTFTGETAELPLDGAAYARRLEMLIAGARL